jgi:hypothetical protein
MLERSLRWPSIPGEANRAFTLTSLMSSGGSTFRKGTASRRAFCPELRVSRASGPSSGILAYSSSTSWMVAPSAGSESPATLRFALASARPGARPCRSAGRSGRQPGPSLLGVTAPGRREEFGLFRVGAREWVADDRDVPGDAIVDVYAEKLGEADTDLPGYFLRDLGCRYQ